MTTAEPRSSIFSAEVPNLLADHFDQLAKGSGIDPALIRERGYRSALGKKVLADLGFPSYQRRRPSLILPICPPDSSNGLYQLRPDNPRLDRDGKPIKYETPGGAGMRIDCPPRCRPDLGDPSVPLYVTEGVKKADAIASRGRCAVALLGVWNWKGRNRKGGVAWLADWDYIALNGREVRVVFDSDVTTKPAVQQAIERLREHLQRHGADVYVVNLPCGPNHAKVGADDYLLAHTIEDMEALIQRAPAKPAAAGPLVELLEEPPPAMTRPLALIDGRAYAAIWPHLRITRTETVGKDGQIVRHNPPLVTVERRLLVVRDDGQLPRFSPKRRGFGPQRVAGRGHLGRLALADGLGSA